MKQFSSLGRDFSVSTLADYLEEAAAIPWQWGAMDCCFFAGEWVYRRTGKDMLAQFRGTYESATGAARLLKAHGGLAEMVAHVLEENGFDPTPFADDGDVGILLHEPGVAGAAMVIRSGPWWIGKSEAGISGIDARALRVWRIT